MSRLSEIFAKNKKCFIPFVTAGHPDLAMSREIILNLAAAGSHMVEIGIPFSDPIADGPIIQKSSFEALKHGYSFSDYIDLVRQLRAKTDLGLIFMTYINPVLKYGLKQLDREGSEAGLDGVLISDLTPEEYSRMEPLQALDTIFLAAPTSSDERLQRIGEASRGFVYLIARTGVTGTQSDVEHLVPETVARLRRYTRLPIAVGFGITSSKDVRKVWQYADGAVVGSAIVRFIEEHQSTADLARKVGEYVRKDLISNA
ncbi:tryptophan synthase subunit alpha [Acidobacteria bacterium AH-259-A15]|nr:tryptophan synthase subunit alpha [Acidobacteria bacterium AH-259-A15]